jgi:carbonic anhydrase
MQYCRIVCLLVCGTFAQESLFQNNLVDIEPQYPPFNFFQEGRDWQGLCATAPLQSPIDISDAYSNLQIVTAANSTFREFRTITPTVEKSGIYQQNVQGLIVDWLFSTSFEQEIFGSMITQTMYEVHFTVPAEHTYNGLRYPLELHVVYGLSQPDGNVVPGVNIILLFREGRAHPFVEDFINSNRTTIDLTSLFPSSGVVDDYYYYVGSVDVPWPDCWTPLSWFLPNYILEASTEQIQYFNDFYINDLSFSNGRGVIRALQPLGNRPTYHFITPAASSFLS